MPDALPPGVEQSFEPASSYQVRDELGEFLARDLLGPWDGETEQFPHRARGPRDRYLVGLLGPKFNPRSTVEAASSLVDTDGGSDGDGEDGELRETFSVQNAGRLWASSMGLSFQVPADVDVVAVRVRWGSYGKVLRDAGEGVAKPAWVRQPVVHELEVRLDGEPSGAVQLDNPGPAEAADAEPPPPPQAHPDADPSGVGIFLRHEVRPCLGADGEPRRVVDLALVNAQLEPPANADTAWIFQPEITITALDTVTAVFLPTDDPLTDPDPPPADPEEQHLRLLYRNVLRHAGGRNVAVHPDVRPGERRAWRLTTTWLPVSDVPSTVAPGATEVPELAGLELSMDTLAELEPENLVAALQPLAAGYADWLDQRAAEVLTLPETLRTVAHQAIYRARAIGDRVGAGIALLRDDAQALDAFRFANRAMALQRRRTALAALREADGLGFAEALAAVEARGPAAATWRPFQLAFVLLNLPGLTDPAHPDRRADDPDARVDLLFFPTGGGKTEAYLGLAAYAFAIRRLQGVLGAGPDARDGGDGVTVLMRYTLRLLTAQQFQRAAALVCAAEILRQRAPDGRYGSEPFRIGLWVGASVAPNWYGDAKTQIDDGRTHGSGKRINTLQTLACPWCGERLRGERDLKTDDDQRRVRLYCPRGEGPEGCPFSERLSPEREGLPILTVDEELYRLTPSLVIATVDKLAQLPWYGFAGHLFGLVRQRCPRHGYRHPDLDTRVQCGTRHNAKGRHPAVTSQPVTRLRPPDLIIQDELHLISGALGTTVGLFEGAVAELSSWSLARPGSDPVRVAPVIVASTATTKRAEAQVRALYGRRLSTFPPQVLDVADTFFSRQVPITPKTPGRRYVGLCAHGVRLKAAEIRLAEILLLAGQALFDRYGRAADPYLTMVGYFNATRELAGMRRHLDDDIATRVRRHGPPRGLPNRVLRSRSLLTVTELTSRISSGDIAAILKQLEYGFDEHIDTSPQWAARSEEYRTAKAERREPVLRERNGPLPVDVVLATSMLQVGVDVARFGLMVVTGQPKNTAEYIQASSRVGRDPARPGLVVTLYNWSRPRDLAHFEDFEPYHAGFYRQVEALSVTPYARRSLDRGTAATTIAALRHASDAYSVNSGAKDVTFTAPDVRPVIERLLRRAEIAGDGERARDYLSDRLGRLQDAWAVRKAGPYDLAYQTRRENQQTFVNLLDPAGLGAWGDLTVARSMRETENELNLLVPGGDLVETAYGAPPWRFGPPPEGEAADPDTGDEFGELPGGRRS